MREARRQGGDDQVAALDRSDIGRGVPVQLRLRKHCRPLPSKVLAHFAHLGKLLVPAIGEPDIGCREPRLQTTITLHQGGVDVVPLPGVVQHPYRAISSLIRPRTIWIRKDLGRLRALRQILHLTTSHPRGHRCRHRVRTLQRPGVRLALCRSRGRHHRRIGHHVGTGQDERRRQQQRRDTDQNATGHPEPPTAAAWRPQVKT